MASPRKQRLRVEVCFSHNLFPLHKDEHEVVVVIDVLRASSAICTAFEYGAKEVIPLSTIEEAQEYKNNGYLAAAERQGKIVEGFEYGNSPFSYMCSDIKDRSIALTTTNGTKAITTASKESSNIVIGSLVNLRSISNWLIKQQKNTLLLCSGWQNRFNLEDSLCGGAIADNLINTGFYASEHDSSIASKYLFRSASHNYFGFLKSSSHRRRLRNLNLNEDIKYCLTPDQTSVVPILEGGRIVSMDWNADDL
ncbi:MAG: 2-phosphosulfolactate phosphatase [Flavobacteriales bacterium]